VVIDFRHGLLSAMLRAGDVNAESIYDVASFVLGRDVVRGLEACAARLTDASTPDRESAAVGAAVALLGEPKRGFELGCQFLDGRPDLAQRVLGEFAQQGGGRHAAATSTPERAGRLLRLLIRSYPFDSDPQHDGAHWVGPNDAARDLRTNLLSWLSQQRDLSTVRVLKDLEREYAMRLPWLRRPRATVERAYRLSQATAIPPETTAAILAASDRRLIRSGSDALEGIRAALNDYQHGLRHDSPSDLEDLWNVPRGGRPTPKAEDRISDKICGVVRRYFQAHAVTADREVQVHRRLIPRAEEGEPGSEPDVLVRIPAIGSTSLDPIAIPLEVKLSCNPEARTGLQDQLVNRYMSQLGTDVGAFIVAWMTAPNMSGRYRPHWETISDARVDLQQQARRAATDRHVAVEAIVVEASLRRVMRRKPRRRGATRRSRTHSKSTARHRKRTRSKR
jgi:hypothetical protein